MRRIYACFVSMALIGQVSAQQTAAQEQADQARALYVQQAIMRMRSCSAPSDKCQAICEAANTLEDASRDLARCASEHDYNDSCDSRFRDVRSAHDDLESAVSDAAGDCE